MPDPIQVLIVDDSADDAELILRALRQGGFEPAHSRVQTEEEFGKALKEQRWDLIICDYVMPHFDAPQALKLYKESGLDIPFMIVSGMVGEETAVSMMKIGAHDFLLKDKMARLAPAIRRELHEAQERLEHRRAQEELQVSLQRLSLANKVGSIGVWDWDLRNDSTTWDDTMYEIYGIPKIPPISDKIFAKLVHPGDLTLVNASLYRTIDERGQAAVEFRIIRPDGSLRYIKSVAGVVLDHDQAVTKVVGVNSDITEQKRAEQSIVRLNRLYSVLSEVSQAGVRCKTRNELFEQICRIIVDFGQFELAWVGLAGIETKSVLPVRWNGAGAEHLKECRFSINDEPGGHGAIGTAIRENRCVYCNDFASSPTVAPWNVYGSFAALPLRFGGRTLGTLNLYASERNFFGKQELTLLKQVASEISYAVEKIDYEDDRLRAENALRRSEEKFRIVADFTFDWEYWLDPDGKFIYVSPSCQRITGYSAAEFENDPGLLERIIHPDDLGIFRAHQAGFEKNNMSGEIDFRIIMRGGEERWVAHQCQFISGNDGRHLGLRAGNRDITDRKHAETASRQSEERYSRFVQISAEGIWRCDLTLPMPTNLSEIGQAEMILSSAHIGECNNAFAQQYGYECAEEMQSVGLTHILVGTHEDKIERVKEFVRNGYRTTDLETVSCGRNGKALNILSNIVGIVENGYLIGLWGMQRDITERKKAIAGLQESEARYRTLFQSSPLPNIIFNPESFAILAVNDAAVESYGYTNDEFLTLAIQDLLAGEGEKALGAALAEEPLKGYQTGIWRHRKKDGTLIDVDVYSDVVVLDGRPLNIIAIKDITDQIRSELEQLKQRQAITAINAISEAITSTLDLNVILDIMLQNLLRLSGADRVNIMLLNDANGCLESVACRNQTRVLSVKLQLKRGEGAAGWVLENMIPLAIPDVAADPRFLVDARFAAGWNEFEDCTVAYLGLPLISKGRAIGVAGMTMLTRREYSDDEISFFQGVCGTAAVGIENAKIHGEIQTRAESLAGEIAIQKQYAENILHSIADGVDVVDAQCFVISWNSAAEQITGWKAEQLVGKRCFYYPQQTDDSGNVCGVCDSCPIALVKKSRQPMRPVEMSRFHHDGREIIVSTSAAPLFDNKGEVVGAVEVFRDISKELELRKSIDQANSAKSSFLANMSHEMRTPLTAILGFTDLLLRDPMLTPLQQEQLNTIDRNGEHLLGIINDVLDLSKIEKGRMIVSHNAFDLHALLRDLESMFRIRAAEAGIQLEFQLASDLPRYIAADEKKLRQIFINLLGNAVKFTDKGSVKLRVSVARGGLTAMRLLAEVEDSGPGISEEERHMLFKSFEQTRSGANKASGTGLGLVISREFARMMGGDIGVSSRDGKGSTFRFEINIEVSKAEFVRKKAVSHRLTRLQQDDAERRILVVDDKSDNREYLSRLLRTVGFKVQQAGGGAEAIEALGVWLPHLIFMDLRMPGMNGYETVRRIRAHPKGKEAKIICITASAYEENSDNVRSVGADDLLLSPFPEDELLEKIQKHLGVEFDYLENDTFEFSRPVTMDAKSLSAAKIASAPADIMRPLREASLHADLDRVLELLGTLETYDDGLAQKLRVFAERFDYQSLIDILPSGGDR